MTEETSLRSRRKPIQERARVTQTAILDAFVRLLLEKGYQRLTIRDIANVAGVGLGTVYEHFPGKKSIAANCIHARFKAVGRAMQESARRFSGSSTAMRVDAMLDCALAQHVCAVAEWAALASLERQISDLTAYRSLYQHFVDIWFEAMANGAEMDTESSECLRSQAATVHAIVYGLIYQTLLWQPERVREAGFRDELGRAVHAYIESNKA